MLQRLHNVISTCLDLVVRVGVAACACVQYLIMALTKTGCIAANRNDAARLPVTADLMHSGYRKALLFSLLLMLLPVSAHALTPPGTVISNTATATFDIGGPAVTAASNTADVVTTIIQTPSTITMYQYDPVGPGTVSQTAVTQHATSGPPGAGFVVSPDPSYTLIGTGTTTLDPTTLLNLNVASIYQTGEPIFITVDDQDQNLDPNAQETVRVVVTSPLGDSEELLLTETGLNTGIFSGYVQSAAVAVTPYDGVLSLGENTSVAVTYVDQYDPTDISSVNILVDPFGIVFSSFDSALQDGLTVEILDGAGNPATVYGNDGVSVYPNVVTTGGTVTDAGGTVYNFPTGSYRFPRLAPGDYQIQVTVPASYRFPSTVSIADLQLLPGAPYALDPNASFGGVFTLVAGPPLRADIAIDPLASQLILEKSASKDTASVGDFVRYTLDLSNADSIAPANNTVITDTLPLGLRYQASSIRVNNLTAPEPAVSADGRTLTFNVGDIPPSGSVQVAYVTEITVGTKLGRAINSAVAVDALGTTSNTAQASINIEEDLFASRSFIAGRIIVGECDQAEAIDAGLPGLGEVRVYMEDGTYSVTDADGKYHFEGVRPGTHVVQVDLDSIPDNLEIIQCVNNTRFAGTPYSQFVDVQGGTLWRADFHVREKPPISDKATLLVQSELNEEDIKYTIDMTNGEIPVKNYRLIVNLPEGIEYDLGSAVLDDKAIDDPYINENVVVFRMGDLGNNWKHRLQFRARLKDKADGELVTTAVILMDTDMKKNVRSVPIKNIIELKRTRVEKKELVYQAFFDPLEVSLSDQSISDLKTAIYSLGDVDIRLNEVIGHSDSLKIRKRSWNLFESNEALSLARAYTVSQVLKDDMGIDSKVITVTSKGSGDPVAPNVTEEGRALNRRAELYVETSRIVGTEKIELVQARSELKEVELKGQPEYVDNFGLTPPPMIEQLDVSRFDEFWLKQAESGREWLMPAEGFIPQIKSVNIAIKHGIDDEFELHYNGEQVNPLFYFGTIKNAKNKVARSYWQGIHLVDGQNKFEFLIKDDNGNVIEKMTRVINFSGIPVRAEIAEEYSRLLADGRRVPVIALRVFDKDGYPARPGSVGKFSLSEPYLAKQEVDAFELTRMTNQRDRQLEYKVGADGIALIVLEPTQRTGKLDITLPFTNNRTQVVQTWLRPEIRDWILVGLADGAVGFNSVSGNMEALDANDYNEDFYSDGKIAFYAKGRVKGDWLLTTAFDSERNRKDGDNRVHQMIDPNTYYTIYGDGSRQRWDASTADKLYIKIEREKFYAMYGDMDTGLTVTELSKFTRRMTGVKSEGEFGKFKYTAFGAENLNNFIKDEIQGEGISGLYYLSGKDIVINGEKIYIETRDRFRSEIIIERKELRRYIDYNIDYQDGTIFFREPIPSKDSNFNPIFIVADYEVETPVDGEITAGGRGAVKLMDDKLEIGATYVHDGSYQEEGDLIGADARMNVTENTQVWVEAATTDGKKAGNDVSGDAYRVEVEHETDKTRARVYIREQDEDFGLGQQSISQTGTRKYGAEGDYRFNEKVTVGGVIYHEDNLITGGSRNVADATLTYGTNRYSLSAGGRVARDEDATGNNNNSNLLMLGASHKFLEGELELRGNAEIALGGKDANPDYPSRFILGADYFITPKVNLFAENEWTIGRDQDTRMARAGVRSTPWTGAQINTAVNQEVLENGLRTFATLGLTQSFKINKRWNGDITFDQTKTMRHPGATPFYAPQEVPIAQGTLDNDFTAVSLGTTYFAETYTINNRVEYRTAEQEDKIGLIANWERILMRGIGYSASLQMFDTDRTDGSGLFDADVRFSLGYRPLDSRWITLNKLELKFDESTDIIGSKTRQRKLINNLVANFMPNQQNQLSLTYGIKYVVDSFDGDEYNGITQLAGGEYRYDLTPKWDIGAHVHTLYSANSSVLDYSTGVSVGWNMARNIWLSLGYNFDGFEDDDFSAAGYTATGPYVRFRMKFDQDTAKQIKHWLN